MNLAKQRALVLCFVLLENKLKLNIVTIETGIDSIERVVKYVILHRRCVLFDVHKYDFMTIIAEKVVDPVIDIIFDGVFVVITVEVAVYKCYIKLNIFDAGRDLIIVCTWNTI